MGGFGTWEDLVLGRVGTWEGLVSLGSGTFGLLHSVTLGLLDSGAFAFWYFWVWYLLLAFWILVLSGFGTFAVWDFWALVFFFGGASGPSISGTFGLLYLYIRVHLDSVFIRFGYEYDLGREALGTAIRQSVRISSFKFNWHASNSNLLKQ